MSLKKTYLILAIVSGLYACSFLEKGYDDANGQYIPKRPRFKLKDKPGNIIPLNLDTNNIYKVYERYERNKIHPSLEDTSSGLNKVTSYVKFYSKGRCLTFSIPNTRKLEEIDLNPNNKYYGKGYYYSKDGKTVRIENFVYGQGYGIYLIFDYTLNTNGDTLIKIYENSKTIYVKEEIPFEWKNYSIDW